jgi:hypothetical protein
VRDRRGGVFSGDRLHRQKKALGIGLPRLYDRPDRRSRELGCIQHRPACRSAHVPVRSVVHFSSIVAACLIILAPIQSWLLFGVLILGCEMFGLAYYAIAWRDTVRTRLSASIALDETGSGTRRCRLVGIHNAWDITVWTITRRRE